MEWLQTYEIGKALLNSGSTIEDAYYQTYRSNFNKDAKERTPCIININLNTKNATVDVERLAFDRDTSIKTDNYFTSVSGNFTSYFICNSFEKRQSILDFLGVKNGDIKPDEIISSTGGKEKIKLSGYKKLLREVSKSRNKDFNNAQFLALRKKARMTEGLGNKIYSVISDLDYIVDKSKKLDKWKSIEIFSESEKKAFSQFPKLNLSKDKGTDEVVFVILSVDGIKLSRDNDYRAFCRERFLHMGQIDYSKTLKFKSYLGNEETVYIPNFPRDSINLLKSTTGSPTSLPNLIGTSFLIGENAYNALKLGAKKIDKELKISIAKIPHYVIPEFTKEIRINQLRSEITEKMELALKHSNFTNTNKSLLRVTNQQINSILLIGHIKGKGDIDFISSIRIPSVDYFNNLVIMFEKAKSFTSKIESFSIQQIYYLFPVPSDKSKKPDSLFFYKSVFENTTYELSSLMDTYARLIQIYKFGRSYDKAGRQYYGGTINIDYSEKPEWHVKISTATKKFQVLLNLLNLLSNKNDTNLMDYSNLPTKTQKVFQQCQYKEDKAALFYLGKLLRLTADAQANKQKNKRRPILDKINYGGMKLEDLKWLCCEILEKMKQYEVLRYAHGDMTEFKRYFDMAEAKGWKLSEIENVFYIFSGYAMYWEVREDTIPKPLAALVSRAEENDVEETDVENKDEEDIKE